MNPDRFFKLLVVLAIAMVLVAGVFLPIMNSGECQAADSDHYDMEVLVKAEKEQVKSLKKIASELEKIRKAMK